MDNSVPQSKTLCMVFVSFCREHLKIPSYLIFLLLQKFYLYCRKQYRETQKGRNKKSVISLCPPPPRDIHLWLPCRGGGRKFATGLEGLCYCTVRVSKSSDNKKTV